MGKLPQSIRYVKNGSGGKWWPAAKAGGQIYLGWWFVPRALLQRADLPGIKACIKEHYTKPGVATADFNAIKLVLENPSRHIWVTFEDSSLWWCTVRNGVTVNLKKENEKTEGSFWLTGDRPWSNQSVGGRPLAISNLPGIVGAVAGFRERYVSPKAHVTSSELFRMRLRRSQQRIPSQESIYGRGGKIDHSASAKRF